MIEFTSVHIKNFLSHRDTYLPLCNRGVVLVLGKNKASSSLDSNGAGKTTVAEAVYWALFGKTFRDIPASHVVNKVAGKDCEVKLTLNRNGDEFVIVRGRKSPADSARLQVITPEGTVTSQDAQKVIDDILGNMDSDQLASMAFFGKGYKVKLFHEMSDSERKALFENVCIELVKLTKMHEYVKKELVELKAHKQKLQYEITSHERALAEAEQNLKLFVERKEEDIKEAKANILASKKIIADLNERLAKLPEAVRPERANGEQEKSLKGQVTDNQTAINSCSSNIMFLRSNIKAATEEKICPTCKRPWPKDDTHKNQVPEWEQELEQEQVKLAKLRKRHEKYEEQLASLRSAYEEEYAKYMELKNRADMLWQSKRKEEELLARYRNILEKAKNADYEAHLQEQVESYQNQVKNAQRAFTATEKQENLMVTMSSIVSDNGLKSYLLDDLLLKIESYADKMSKYLSGGELQIQVSAAASEFRKKDGNIVIKAINDAGSDIYAGNSSGEKTRVDLCILFSLVCALHEMYGVDIKFLFLDEVLDSLDDAGVDAVIELLEKEILPIKKSIFVTSHNESLKNSFQNVITITKERTR